MLPSLQKIGMIITARVEVKNSMKVVLKPKSSQLNFAHLEKKVKIQIQDTNGYQILLAFICYNMSLMQKVLLLLLSTCDKSTFVMGFLRDLLYLISVSIQLSASPHIQWYFPR